jgi:hypothetical protein
VCSGDLCFLEGFRSLYSGGMSVQDRVSLTRPLIGSEIVGHE